MTYARGAGGARAAASPLALLPFVALAIVLSGGRLLATTAAMTSGTGTQQPTTQTWVFAALWIAEYFAEAVAGWLLWRSRTLPYGRAAMVTYWILLGLQGLRLLNLLGSRLTAGQLPWSAFGTVVLLDVVAVVGVLLAWQVSRAAGAILAVDLGWLLVVTAITGADALMQYGLPLT